MQLFHVPIIQPDLRHEDTVIQAANALNHLQHVIDSVFDRIDARIDRNASRIVGIQQRLDAANRLGQQLVGKRSAAVRIVSPAEYPIASRCADVPMTFGVAATAAISSTTKMDHQYAENNSKVCSSAPERWSHHQNTRCQAEDKLQFYHVKRNPPAVSSSYNSDGLGERVPTFVDAVDGVLLHNTGENVYADYKNAAAAKLRKRALAEKTTGRQTAGMLIRIENNGSMDDSLGAAPPSISNRSRSQQQHRGRNDADDSLFYAPSSSEAPIIEVPLDLPDLPGIALNVELSVAGRPNTITTGNATTAALLSDLPDLPELLAVDAADERNARNVVGVANVLATPPLPPPPPPPPPPQPSSVDVPDVMTSSGVMSAGPTQPPPPPPPPPPPAPSSLPAIQTPTAPIADDRSNLMAAIRQAAGKKTLRTPSMQETTSEKKDSPKTPATSGGNLMDDLHKRLALRRQGISGGGNKDGSDSTESKRNSTPPGGIMKRISSMIPPPPPRQHAGNNSTSGTSGDDNDDDDWN